MNLLWRHDVGIIMTDTTALGGWGKSTCSPRRFTDTLDEHRQAGGVFMTSVNGTRSVAFCGLLGATERPCQRVIVCDDSLPLSLSCLHSVVRTCASSADTHIHLRDRVKNLPEQCWYLRTIDRCPPWMTLDL